MSGWRNTAIFATVLIALAAYFYFFELDKKSEDAVQHVFDMKLDEVTRVTVTTENGTTTMESIPRQGWQIVTPLSYSADPEALKALLTEFTGVTYERTIADSAVQLAEYGLDPPKASVEVAVGFATSNVLLLGDANPTGVSFYAAVKGGDKVFLISNQTNSALRRETQAFRDRRLVTVNQDRVDGFVVKTKDHTLDCRIDSIGTWRVLAPFQLPAEHNEAVSLIGNVVGMRALEFIDERPSDLSVYGLDPPAVTATLKSRDGSINATISLGKVEGDRIYVMSSERSALFKISSHMLDQVNRDPDLYRRKSAFVFRSYEVPKFDLTLDGETVSVVKRSFDDWLMVKPIDFRANDQLITAMLDSLEVMKINEYIPATPENRRRYGLDQASTRFSLTIEKRSIPQEIVVSNLTENGQRYLHDPVEEWIYRVNATGLAALPAAVVDLRNRKVLRFKGIEVNMFEITQGSNRLRVRRDQKERTVWKLEAPINSDANAITVGELFSVVDSLYFETFITDDPKANLNQFSLDKPSMEINLLIGGRDSLPEERQSLLVGHTFPGDNRLIYVKRRDNPAVGLVNASFIKKINSLLLLTNPTS